MSTFNGQATVDTIEASAASMGLATRRGDDRTKWNVKVNIGGATVSFSVGKQGQQSLTKWDVEIAVWENAGERRWRGDLLGQPDEFGVARVPDSLSAVTTLMDVRNNFRANR